MEKEKIIAYKGFDNNLCCKGFQFKVGEEYEQQGEIKCCENGFHACTNPFDVLNYYGVNGKNRFCQVEQYGTIDNSNEDTKQASSKIKIKAEIGMAGLFKAGIEWIKEKTNPIPIINETKDKTDNTSGDSAKIGSSGYSDKIGSSGDSAQIGSSGYYAQIGSSGGFAKIGSTGDYAKIGSSGGYAKIDSIGEDSVICCAGDNSMAKAKKGSWITLSEWKYSKEKKHYIPVCVKTEFVDGERIKEDTWYKLVNGNFEEQ